jgi:putative flippase GtrA
MRALYTKQFLRYALAGACAMVIDLFLLSLLVHRYSLGYKQALFLSSLCGFLVNFALSGLFVFKGPHQPLVRMLFRHYFVSMASIGLQIIAIVILVNYFSLENVLIARLLAGTGAFVANFFVIRYFVFVVR